MRKIVGKIVGKLGYRDWMTRVILSLVAAHYVLAINEPEPFFEFIQLPGYPALLLQNWLMAFFIINFIYTVSERLNSRFPLTGNLAIRILLQIIFGFLVPSIVLFLLAYLFFWINDVDMMATSYAKLEWWFSILFLILVNCYYVIRHLMRYILFQKSGQDEVSGMGSSEGIMVKDGNELIRIPVSDVTHIHHVLDTTLVYVLGGKQYLTDKTVTALADELNPRQFYKIHRSQIINRNIVQGYSPASSNRLKLKTRVQEEFYVSQRSRADFKKWWERE